ncbi:MAG TPA: hypothetical protein VJB06_02415 [archaeon]|uniref:Seg n=1 Tax=uncultured archaeon Rifle_16ft_4_minimus_37913 TaxID=1665152 RepID=A0A0H4TA14_9ARCH|nr:seg [uncultured archaeon Rifle_16ft_4_minimus_37913]HKZ33959.1 hypothetical protein [Candidatus Nanoarchaeia archaeon]HLD41862.1 hypothetical protein [archaeon]
MDSNRIPTIIAGTLLLVLIINLISAVIIDVDYVTLYPGEEGRVSLNVENNENFDIEDVSVALVLSEVPFTSVGSSTKDVDDIDEDDDDSVSFTLRPSTDIVPGDYDIPYTVKYVDAGNNTEDFTENGSFGIRVSAKTDLDFSAETRETAVVGKEGQVSIEIVNRGLGEIKSVSVQVFPQGFELLSNDKVFVGTIDADDSDTATFDVIYKNKNPVFSARVTYKDFDNKDKTETVSLPVRVYTEEEALELGLIDKSNTWLYIGIGIVVLILWYFWRRARKRKNVG